MRRLIVLALGLGLAGAAHAQYQPIQPIKPIPPIGSIPSIGGGTFKPYQPPAPYRPPALPSVYDDGPFSPAAETRRARKAAQPPAGGMFSPEAGAKRDREREKHFHPF